MIFIENDRGIIASRLSDAPLLIKRPVRGAFGPASFGPATFGTSDLSQFRLGCVRPLRTPVRSARRRPHVSSRAGSESSCILTGGAWRRVTSGIGWTHEGIRSVASGAATWRASSAFTVSISEHTLRPKPAICGTRTSFGWGARWAATGTRVLCRPSAGRSSRV